MTDQEYNRLRLLHGKGYEVLVSTHKYCDFCEQDGYREVAAVDGRTTLGMWANMCTTHFKQYGVGLGVGSGQKLIYK